MGLFVFSTAIGIGNSDTGINPGFMHIKTTTVLTEDFKCHVHTSIKRLSGTALTESPAKSSRFERDKFTGYLFAPLIDALTERRTI